MIDSLNLRPNGVMVPNEQLSPGKGPPKTIVACCEMQTFAVDYVDESGKRHVTTAHRVGGVWHLPPNGESYTAALRPLKDSTWLSQLLEDKFRETNVKAAATVMADIAKDDAVDPLADQDEQ